MIILNGDKNLRCQINNLCINEATCQIDDLEVCPKCFEDELLKKLINLSGTRDRTNTFKAREEVRQKQKELMKELETESESGVMP